MNILKDSKYEIKNKRNSPKDKLIFLSDNKSPIKINKSFYLPEREKEVFNPIIPRKDRIENLKDFNNIDKRMKIRNFSDLFDYQRPENIKIKYSFFE